MPKRDQNQQETPEETQERTDASGRVLYPWEVSPEDQTFAVKVDESGEQVDDQQVQTEQPAASAPDNGNTEGGY